MLPPQRGAGIRARLAGSVFSDRNLDLLSHVLDDCFHVPGTSWRFGLDGLIGLVPFAGDALAGVASTLLIVAAWVRGVPTATLLRMLSNLAIGVLVGTVPILGDLFDISWKANRRNYALLARHLAAPNQHAWRDWLFLAALLLALLVLLSTPLIALGWIAHAVLAAPASYNHL